jgi:hypothetical protein
MAGVAVRQDLPPVLRQLLRDLELVPTGSRLSR